MGSVCIPLKPSVVSDTEGETKVVQEKKKKLVPLPICPKGWPFGWERSCRGAHTDIMI